MDCRIRTTLELIQLILVFRKSCPRYNLKIYDALNRLVAIEINIEWNSIGNVTCKVPKNQTMHTAEQLNNTIES